jgi:hypothetical protein
LQNSIAPGGLAGDFNSATAHFDRTMQQKLSAEAVASAWAEYQQQFGTYQSHRDPQDVPRGDFTVVNIPLKMATPTDRPLRAVPVS